MLKFLFGKKPKSGPNKFQFKVMHKFENRFEESQRVLNKYPDKIPVIVEKSDNSTNDFPEIDKHKWLIREDLTIGQFLLTIRRRIKLNENQALFLFVGQKYIPSNSDKMKSVYEKYKDKDGFLYISYSEEQCYGI